MKSRSLKSTLFAVLVVLIVGCGGGSGDKWKSGRTKTVPVKGVLTHRDLPVSNATVILVPIDSAGKAATGVTDAEGKFELMTFEPKDGAVPGKFTVTVFANTSSDSVQSLTDGPSEGATETKVVPIKSSIPAKYSSSQTSNLTVDVLENHKEPLKLGLSD